MNTLTATDRAIQEVQRLDQEVIDLIRGPIHERWRQRADLAAAVTANLIRESQAKHGITPGPFLARAPAIPFPTYAEREKERWIWDLVQKAGRLA